MKGAEWEKRHKNVCLSLPEPISLFPAVDQRLHFPATDCHQSLAPETHFPSLYRRLSLRITNSFPSSHSAAVEVPWILFHSASNPRSTF